MPRRQTEAGITPSVTKSVFGGPPIKLSAGTSATMPMSPGIISSSPMFIPMANVARGPGVVVRATPCRRVAPRTCGTLASTAAGLPPCDHAMTTSAVLGLGDNDERAHGQRGVLRGAPGHRGGS